MAPPGGGGKPARSSKDGLPGLATRVRAARLDGRSWHAIGAFHLVPLLITAICFRYLWVARGSHLLLLSSLRPFFLLLTHASHQHKAERTKEASILLLSMLALCAASLKKGKLMHIVGHHFLPGSQKLHTKRCGCCRFVSIIVSESAFFSFFFLS